MIDILPLNLSIPQTRSHIKFKYLTNKQNLAKPLTFQDKDAQESFFSMGDKPSKEVLEIIREKKFQSMGFQVNSEKKNQGVNTQYIIYKNINIQTEQVNVYAEQDQKTEIKLYAFLKDVFLQFEEALIDNEILKIYKNDLIIGDIDGDDREETTELSIIKELKSFEFENSNQQNISQIEFLPSHNIMAVSLIQNFTFEERIDITGSSFNSQILLWNYEEFHRFTPIGILESPLEVTTFSFKPDNPQFIVVGTMSGQILLFDILKLVVSSNQSYEILENKHKETKDILYFYPVIQSQHTESFNANQNLISKEIYSKKQLFLSSHRSPVKSLIFLPKNVQLDRKNPLQLAVIENQELQQDQFMTLSMDGQILFWSLDFNDIKEKHKISLQDFNFQNTQWKALLQIQLFSLDQKPLLTSMFVSPIFNSETIVYCSTQNGDMYKIDYDISKNFQHESGKVELIKEKWEIETDQVIVSMDVNVFIEELILMVSDTCFYLYYGQSNDPVFLSPFLQNTKLTSGKFSVSRPSVIFLGRDDGIMDIWDFVDQTGTPSQQQLVSAAGIDYIQINSVKTHIIAVGDYQSCVHLLNLPKSLYKSSQEEEQILRSFLDKEKEKITYYRQRFNCLQKEKDELDLQNQEENYNEDKKGHHSSEGLNDDLDLDYQNFLNENFNEKQQEEDIKN